MVFMRVLVLCPVFIPVASAVATRLDNAQDFVDALCSVTKVAVFPQIRGFSASFGEFCDFGILALALEFPGCYGGVAI